MAGEPTAVWTPGDFADLASRAAIDKTLQRLEALGEMRRIDRGLYYRPTTNSLTARPTVPDYRAIVRAVARRDKVRFVVNGVTAANELGLTTAVPTHIEVIVDARLKPIRLGNQQILFKLAAPSRLYWAGRPAMRVVQALHWMQDVLHDPDERARVAGVLRRLFADPEHGQAIRDDLREGLSALPIWIQELPRNLISPAEGREAARTSASISRSAPPSQRLPRSLRVHHYPRGRVDQPRIGPPHHRLALCGIERMAKAFPVAG